MKLSELLFCICLGLCMAGAAYLAVSYEESLPIVTRTTEAAK